MLPVPRPHLPLHGTFWFSAFRCLLTSSHTTALSARLQPSCGHGPLLYSPLTSRAPLVCVEAGVKVKICNNCCGPWNGQSVPKGPCCLWIIGGGQGVMGLGLGGLRQWLWLLEKKVQDKRLFTSMYTSLVQDLLKDGHIARAT